MLNDKDPSKNPDNPENPRRNQPEIIENGSNDESLFSPRFRSVAAMAGWDEEALLIASYIVEDTPDRQSKQKKRSILQNLKTPPSNSRRKRRAQRRSPASQPPVATFNLDDDEPISKPGNQLSDKEKTEIDTNTNEMTVEVEEKSERHVKNVSSASPAIPSIDIDRLREELSCSICLDVCYEPSTTPCGHSFCKKCLRSAAVKCGKKCPKCRQLISNGRHCIVNTVLWNTIQLLFPQEVEARKKAISDEPHQTEGNSEVPRRQHRQIQALDSVDDVITGQERRNNRIRSRNLRASGLSGDFSVRRQFPSQDEDAALALRLQERRNNHIRSRNLRASGLSGDFSVRRQLPSQDEDAALALRLQREEFMDAFRESDDQSSSRRSSLARARANLRAMASQAINLRIRDRTS